MKLIYLTNKFYQDFSHYAEIEYKEDRPYILLIVTFNDLDFAIPFRSYISHNYCFKTIKAPTIVNGRETWSGIDYSKSIIVFDKEYISTAVPTIRDEEFNNIKFKEFVIKKKFVDYINQYIDSFSKIQLSAHRNRDLLLCKFSTLQNYHRELKIQHDFSLVMKNI